MIVEFTFVNKKGTEQSVIWVEHKNIFHKNMRNTMTKRTGEGKKEPTIKIGLSKTAEIHG